MPSSDSEVPEPGDGGHPSFLRVSRRGFLSHLCRPRRFGKHLFKPWLGHHPTRTHFTPGGKDPWQQSLNIATLSRV